MEDMIYNNDIMHKNGVSSLEEYTLGRLIRRFRREHEISREDFGAGIVSGNVLQKLEEGIKHADKMTMDFLLARAGLSSLFYECYISDQELELYDQRMEIRCKVNQILEQLYRKRELEKVPDLVKEGYLSVRRYQSSWKKLGDRFVSDGSVHQFFSGMMEAYLLLAETAASSESGNGNERRKQIEKTWSFLRTETFEALMEKEQWPFLSAMELECLMLAAHVYETEGKRREAKTLLYRIWNYRGHHEQELEEQVKIYPYAVRYLAQLEAAEGNRNIAFALCAEAMELLAEAHSLRGEVALMDFMLENWQEGSGYSTSRNELEAQRDCLLELYQRYGENPYGIYPMMTMENGILASEAVKRGRVSLGMTQRQLSDGIVEPETVSRFESGKLRLRWSTVMKLLERLGMKSKKIWLLVESDQVETVMRFWKLGTHLGTWQPGAAMEQIRCWKRELDLNSVVNRQLLQCYEMTVQKQRYRIKADEAMEKRYLELLRMTLPGYPDINWDRTFLTRNEVVLVNAIAIYYEMMERDEEAITLYEKCRQNLEQRKVNQKYPLRYLEMILNNLANKVGAVGKTQEAISLSDEILKMMLMLGCGKGMAEALYEIAWDLKEIEKRGDFQKESSTHFFALSWHKALLEGNREFLLFLQARKSKYEYVESITGCP